MEIFKIVDTDGLTPLLMVLNEGRGGGRVGEEPNAAGEARA